MKSCPYGNGVCSDPGIPSDCEVNEHINGTGCLFSKEEKEEFDKQPNRYELVWDSLDDKGESIKNTIRFKNLYQIEFFLRDRKWIQNVSYIMLN